MAGPFIFDFEDAFEGARPPPALKPGAVFDFEDAWEVPEIELPPEPAPAPEIDGPPGRVMSDVGAVARGFANVGTGVVRQSQVPHSRNDRALLQIFDRIDETGQPVPIQETGQYGLSTMSYPLVDIYSRSTPEERLKIRGPLGTGDPRDTGIYRAAERVQGAVERALPVDPTREQRLETKLFGGLGSLGGFIFAGVLGRITGTGTLITGGLVGSRAAGDEAFQDALASGASLEDATKTSVMMERIGFGEILPVAQALDRFDRASGGQARKWIGRMITVGAGGFEEALQEGSAKLIQNFLASKLFKFDEERQVFEGVGENAGIGFTLGALMNFLAEAAGGRRARGRQGAEETPPGPVAPPEVDLGAGEAPAAPGAPEQPRSTPEAPSDGRTPLTVGLVQENVPLPEGWKVVPNPAMTGVLIVNPEGGVQEAISAQVYARDEDPLADLRGRVRKAVEAYEKKTPPKPKDDGPPTIVPPETPRDSTGKPQRGAPDQLAGIPLTVFRGSGRSEQMQGTGAAALLGPGGYFAFERADASEFGPNVEQTEMTFTNPLVVRSDDQWRDLAKRAGFEFPNPFGLEPGALKVGTDGLAKLLEQGGHDALIATWDNSTTTDQDKSGNFVKLLRNAFGVPQVFVPAARAEAGGLFDEGAAEQGAQGDLELSRQPRGPGTPEFDAWFKGSRVVGENGDPLVMYHGTGEDIDAFEAEHQTGAFFFTPDPEVAGDFAQETDQPNIVPVYIRAVNPFDYENQAHLKALGDKLAWLGAGRGRLVAAIRTGDYTALEKEHVQTAIRALGHDGFYVTEGAAGGAKNLAVFEQTQIKSVHNRGAFDPNDARIDRSKAPVDPSIEHAQEGPGENYVGFRTTADTETPGEIPPIKGAVSREDVIRPILAALGHRVFEGPKHFKVKAEGFFRKPGREVRVKKHGDIQVTLHELAHLIDDLDPEIGKAYRSKEFKRQIRGVSYEKTKLNEGFAEFVRLWSTQRESLKERAPEFTDWFERYLDRQPWGKAFRESAALAHKWFEQDSARRVITKFGTTDDINAGKKRRSERFRQNVFDDLEALKQAEITLFGEVMPMGFYETARLTRGVGAVVDGAMKWGAPKILPDGRWVFVDKNGESATNWNKAKGKVEANPDYQPWGLRTLLDPIWKRRREFGLYAVGRRAEFLKRQGRENLFDPSDIRTMLALGEKYPEFEAVFQDYQKFNKQVLDFGQQTGIINREGRESWETDVYIPFWRVSAEKKGRPAAYQKGLPGFTNMIVRLRGGTQNLRDPIQNMFENMQRMVEAGVMNNAKRSAINTISRTPGGGAILAKIGTDTKQVTTLTQSVAAAMQDALAENAQGKATKAVEEGADPAAALEAMQEQQAADREAMEDIFSRMPAFMKVLQPGIAPEGSDIHVHMENGRPVFTQILDPLTYRALATLPRSKSVGPIIRMLKVSRRLMQMSITISFNFAFRNIARDQFMGASLSRYGYKPGIDAIRGMRSRVMQDPLFKEMMANGGGIAGFWSQDHQSNGKLAKFYGSQGISYKTVMNSPVKMFRAFENIVDAFESATRLGEARMGIKKGAHPREAALGMREVSTDFAMRGDHEQLGYLYDSILFLKAGTVGVDRLYRGMVQDKHRKRAWTWAAGIGLVSMGLHLINMGNPLYDGLDDWDRHSSWHFYIPNARYFAFLAKHGREPKTRREALPLYEHFRMPKPFELGGLGSIAEETVSLIAGQYSAKEYGDQIRQIIMDMFRFDYLPALLRPAMDVKSNELSFFNVPIETQSMEQLQKWARYSPRTSKVMQAYGNYVLRNLPKSAQDIGLVPSPAQLEALIRGYTNAWGLYGLTLADAVFFDDTPDIRTNQIPGLSVFYRQDRGGRTKYSNMFYELVRESVEARRTMVATDRANRPEWADALAVSRENLEYQQMGRAEKEARAIGNELKAVQLAQGLEGTRELAAQWGKERGRRDYFTGLRKSKKWNDVGALKAELLTYWIEERNDLFELVVKDIEAQRDEE